MGIYESKFMSNSDAEMAYLAGVVDGDGCLRLEKVTESNHYRPVLKVEMNDRKVILWIQHHFGGCVTSKKGDPNSNREYGYSWRMRGRRPLKILLPRLRGFLITKQLQALVLLEFMDEFSKGSGNGRYSALESSRMDDYHDILKKLNSRGTGSNELKEVTERALLAGNTVLRRVA